MAKRAMPTWEGISAMRDAQVRKALGREEPKSPPPPAHWRRHLAWVAAIGRAQRSVVGGDGGVKVSLRQLTRQPTDGGRRWLYLYNDDERGWQARHGLRMDRVEIASMQAAMAAAESGRWTDAGWLMVDWQDAWADCPTIQEVEVPEELATAWFSSGRAEEDKMVEGAPEVKDGAAPEAKAKPAHKAKKK